MSYLVRGKLGATLVRERHIWDAERFIYIKEQTWEGIAPAILGMESDLQAAGLTYDLDHSGPLYTITFRVPEIDPTIQVLDRYEISTGSESKSLLELPSIVEEARLYDAALTSGGRTYRKWVEEALKQRPDTPLVNNPSFPLWDDLVANMRSDVTGFPVDYLLLRRFRTLDNTFASSSAGKINLGTSRIIYSTSQLQLPNNVAFVLPDTPAENAEFNALFFWGWRVQSQNVEISGQWTQQTIELIFAPHSKLAFIQSTSNLAW